MPTPQRKNPPISGTFIYDAASDNYVAWDGSITSSASAPVFVDQIPFGSIISGQKSVTTAGTREVLGASTAIQGIIIKANRTNTGNIFVGDATVASSNGFVLDRGAAVSFDVDNLADIYIDSSVNGEGVSFIAAIA